MTTESYDPRDYRYFYVAYNMGLGCGSLMLRQKQQIDGQPDNGFNIATASQYLLDLFKMTVIITFWQEVTYVRYMQWDLFLKRNCKKDLVLSIHQGEKKGEAGKSTAPLKIIEPEPEP